MCLEIKNMNWLTFVVAKDTYEYEYRYTNMLPNSDEIETTQIL